MFGIEEDFEVAMFLDDIHRQANRENKKEFWDKWAYYDLNSEEVSVNFISGIRLLYIKNLANVAINIDVDKLRIKLLAGEDKYLVRVGGSQLVIYPLGMAGRVFVGQSTREDTNLLRSVAIGWGLLGLIAFAGIGCASLPHGAPPAVNSFKTPEAPHGARLPVTPKLPSV